MNAMQQLEEQAVVHTFDSEDNKKSMKNVFLFIAGIIIILMGVGTGYVLSHNAQGTSPMSTDSSAAPAKKIVGSKDSKTFKDTAEGTLQEGGIDGEGTHKLLRPGGDSQTVYLTSSVVDLNEFIGKKVRVLGQTMAAKKAGWLMDVGRVELLE